VGVRHRLEALERVVRQLLEHARVDGVAAGHQREHVAIGRALATNSVPMTPVAPALLSMVTGWPQLSVIFWPMRRASRSMAPPGEAGTTMVMGLVGKAS
jgi:hypothetical protein